MNKNDLIEALTKVLSTKKEARDAVETVFKRIQSALKEGDKAVISGFGSLHAIAVKAKTVRNPKTGQLMNIAPRKKVRFKQAKDFFN